MVGVDASSLQADSQLNLVGLLKSRRPPACPEIPDIPLKL